ncbi:hypothetical protein [Diatraea saccharalis granulovirus]|uniref:Uncharacterized protein n=1 Tax=Diatraea saccharalis granulovirus TaxID=1675862 RepID=A0A0R7EYQ1_9BBAC|nr:hypothetical protein [Diatraea saccharalis granulovirus]AKN80712.1 hypothetical protein [Diatraea saccharalis granulovirus]
MFEEKFESIKRDFLEKMEKMALQIEIDTLKRITDQALKKYSEAMKVCTYINNKNKKRKIND